jgi:hypothetical protein
MCQALAKGFMCVTHLSPQLSYEIGIVIIPHFIDDEIEA